MPDQPEGVTTSHQGSQFHVPWWVRLCRWLWKIIAFLGVSVILSLVINVVSTWLTSSKGMIPADAPFSELMKYWPITLLVGCCFLLFAGLVGAISRWNTPTEEMHLPTVQKREHLLGRLLLRYEQLRIQSLQGAIQMEVGLASSPTTVQNAVSLSFRLPDQPEQLLPSHFSIVDAYKQAQQELLILGEPGAGKSTLLLELALYLVEQSAQDATQPLPVLLPLSSWAATNHQSNDQSLQNWLSDQCKQIYEVPPGLSQQWIKTEQLLFLLDGLDEMQASARTTCIAAINKYHRDHLQPLVVCSRTNEYEASSTHERLTLHAAVVVQPLSPKKIDAYLENRGKPLAALRSALKKNVVLAELATTPLMLHVLILAYRGIAVRELSHKDAQLRQQIWEDYVQRLVNSKGEKKGDAVRYPLEQTQKWLHWLAQEMRKHNQTIFFLERLQPDWLPEGKESLYYWSVVLFFGLLFGPFFGLLFGLLFGPLFGLFFGPLFGLFLGLLGVRVNRSGDPVEDYIIAKMVDKLMFGWLSKILPTNLRSFSGLVSLLGFFGLLTGLLTGLIAVLLFRQIITFFGLFSLSSSLARSLLNPKNSFLQLVAMQLPWMLTSILATVSIFVLFFVLFGLSTKLLGGLVGVVQSYTVRFWLWHTHTFPLKAVRFLDDATARILLRRVGDGYSFWHRLLLDYFDDLDRTESSEATHAQPTKSSQP